MNYMFQDGTENSLRMAQTTTITLTPLQHHDPAHHLLRPPPHLRRRRNPPRQRGLSLSPLRRPRGSQLLKKLTTTPPLVAMIVLLTVSGLLTAFGIQELVREKE